MLAIIPARGGSKGINKKNLSLINNQTLVGNAISVAQSVSDITDIIVSSDSDQILKEAKSLGVFSGYNRPNELSQDSTSMNETVAHVIRWYKNSGKANGQKDFILLQPTSPLRNSSDIRSAINQYRKNKARSLVTVNAMAEHPFECVEITDSEWNFLRQPSETKYRRQDYSENFYYINGAIYILNIDWFLQSGVFVQSKETIFSIMPRERSIDIDDYLDLEIARTLAQKENGKAVG